MGLFDWLRKRKKKPEEQAATVDKEKETLERTSELREKVKEQVGEEPKRKRTRKKRSA